VSGITGVVLAAGVGSRMRSQLIKILHPVAGRPMVAHVVSNLRQAGVEEIIAVIGPQADLVQRHLGDAVRYVMQEHPLGTGHAVQQASPLFDGIEGHVLVLYADNLFIGPDVIKRLMERHLSTGARATLLTAEVSDPRGLGRIVRNEAGRCIGIVEEKDATPEQKRIREIWPGMIIFQRRGLRQLLDRLDNRNAQGEYYLPRVVDLLVGDGEPVEVACEATEEDALAPNDRVQLAQAEAVARRRVAERLMLSGVTIVDPATTYIDQDAAVGQDTVIRPFTFIRGQTVIGRNCVVGPGAVVDSSAVADGVVIELSVVEHSRIGPDCHIGPYAHLRPGCELESGVQIGNYAELKKAKMGRGAKMHHHGYLGDVTVGDDANIGAGVITSNYDGVNKWPTAIGPGAFIGTNVNLVAPITVGEGSYVAAGSTINKDVPPGALAIARPRQENKEGYAERLKARRRTPPQDPK
jgi:bifunctional UDP-N-acetylglucosamine pyrophosphorylase / glucosamine-1-phosphate N-acetyltransferase